MDMDGLVTFIEDQTYSSDYLLSQKDYEATAELLVSRLMFSIVCVIYQFLSASHFRSMCHIKVRNHEL